MVDRQSELGLTLLELVMSLAIISILAIAATSVGKSPSEATALMKLRAKVAGDLVSARNSALAASNLAGQQVSADFSAVGDGFRLPVSVEPTVLTFTFPHGALAPETVSNSGSYVNVVMAAGSLESVLCIRAETGRLLNETCS